MEEEEEEEEEEETEHTLQPLLQSRVRGAECLSEEEDEEEEGYSRTLSGIAEESGRAERERERERERTAGGDWSAAMSR